MLPRTRRPLRAAAMAAVSLVVAVSMARAQDAAPAPNRADGEGPFARLIIRGATLIDGTGAPPRGPVDIVIEQNRITQIANVGTPGVPIRQNGRPRGPAREINAEGMYVLPGFIDLHVHTGGVPKAPEELYDLETDRDEVKNLATSTTHRAILEKFRKANREHLLRIRDVCLLPEGSDTRQIWSEPEALER